MANQIILKRSATPGKVPTTAQLALGEIAINTYDGLCYIKKDNGTASVVQIGGVTSVNSETGSVVLDTGDIAENGNLYFTNARARSALSAGSGISYNSTTGAISTTQNLTTAGSPTFAGLTLTGNQVITGNIVPTADNVYSLGSPSMQWKDVYVGPGSLYVNGVEVIHSTDQTMNFTSDTDQNMRISTTGTGILQLGSNSTVVQMAGTLQITSGKNITDSAGSSVGFGNAINMNSNKIVSVGAPSASTDAATKGYVDTAIGAVSTSSISQGNSSVQVVDSGTGSVTVTVDGSTALTVSGSGVTVAGNFTVQGTTTTVESNTVSVADNILTLNSDVTGTPTQNAGIEVERGDEANVQVRWNEGSTKWTFTNDGAVYYPMATSTTDLAEGTKLFFTDARARGALSASSATGVSYNSTTGAISLGSIPNSSLSNSSITINGVATSLGGTRTLDSDSISEGTTNLYHTAARARSALSAGTGISYNSTTGAISTSAIPNASLANSAVTVGSTSISLGATSTTLAGLTSVTSTSFTGALTGNADTATSAGKWTTSRTITLGGDLTGSVSIDGSANATLTATVAANSVALGTDTTGNYMVDLTAGTGITVTHTPGEGSNATIAVDTSTIATQSWVTSQIATKDNTDEITEGVTNLYFTNARARSALSGSTGISYNSSTGAIAIDSTVATLTGTQTLTNKTLTAPVIGSTGATFNGSTSGTAVLSAPAVAGTATAIVLPSAAGTLVGTGDTGSVTNTMLAGSIANAKLANSSVTVGSTSISLGSSATTLAGLTSVTSTGFTGALTGNASTATALQTARTINGVSFDGSANVTVHTAGTGISVSGTTVSIDTATTVDKTTAQTLTNKSLSDSTTYIIDETDGTKKLQFQVSGITTGTTRTLTAPDVNGTIITTGDTGTVTNTMLAGSIANAKLANSSVTVGTTAISLGSSSTTLAGLTSVTSTSFVGALTGNASTVTNGVYTTDTGTVTNTMLAGSIANAKLANSSTTIGTTAISLGSSSTTLAGMTGITFSGSTSGTAQIVPAAAAGTGTVLTLPSATGTLATLAGTETLTNKTIAAGSNTISGLTNSNLSGSAGITNANLANSSITVNGSAISLGGSATIKASTTNALTIGTGLGGTSFDGSGAVTITNTGVTSITGTANQVTASASTGGVTLSLPQSIATTSSPTFATVTHTTSGVFNGSTSGSVTVQAAAVAGTGTVLTLPATTGTVVTTGDTGTVTNTMLAGSIANAKLANSSITVNGTSISLGGSGSITTANISEVTNLYYTDARARAALSFTAGSGAYNSTTGVITIPTNTNQLTNGAGFITGYTETDTLSSVTGRGATTGSAISITNATASSSKITGALIVTGGVGISGALYVGGEVTAYASDAALKTNVVAIDSALSKVEAIRGVSYDWNEAGVALGLGTSKQIGVIAQEVEAVLPELVVQSAHEGYKTVKYDKLTALLIEAVKDLSAKVKTLEAQLGNKSL